MTLQKRKSLAFAAALKEFDEFKKQVDWLLSAGRITQADHDKMLRDKGRELDL